MNQKEFHLDSINLEILRSKQGKARTSNVEIARMLNLAPPAVLDTLKNNNNWFYQHD